MAVTFMFTDIESSTLKWQRHSLEMPSALERHDQLVRNALLKFGGKEIKHTGDGFMAVFRNGRALECALEIQTAMRTLDWSPVDGLRIRIGIDSGNALEREGDFFGEAVNRTARLMSAGWGGQTVVGSAAAAEERLPDGAALEDRGLQLLKDLLEPLRIFTLSHGKLTDEYPPLRTLSGHPNNLPVQPTPFIGRRNELNSLSRLIKEERARRITVLGYGGSGKTRTALQLAARISTDFPDGVWFIPLENVPDRAGIVESIASALSLRLSPESDGESQVIRHLQNRRIMLILDNFEHLSDHAGIVSDLTAGAEGLTVVVTSRKRLDIAGESVFDLAGMDTSASGSTEHGSDSFRLFVTTAARVSGGFKADEEEAGTITELCRLLDGSPLAIELAAPWVRLLSVEELHRELRRNMSLIASVAGDRPERHSSLEALFKYSWALLSDSEKRALAGMSIFEAPFSRTAAERVACCGLITLRGLCDKSLVRRAGDGYSLHPLTREFARRWQKLLPDLEAMHAGFFFDLVEEQHGRLAEEEQADALQRISRVLPDFHKAAVFAFSTVQKDRMSTAISLLSPVLQVRSRYSLGVAIHQELLQVHRKAGNRLLDDQPFYRSITARLHERLSAFHLMSGNRKESRSHLERAAKLSGEMDDPGFRTLCLAGLGNLSYMEGDLAGAETHWSGSLRLARLTGNSASVASLLMNLSAVARTRQELEKAEVCLEEAELASELSGDLVLEAEILVKRGELALSRQNAPLAEDLFQRALDLNRRLGNQRRSSFCLENLAWIAMDSDPVRAGTLASQAVEQAESSGVSSRLARSRICLSKALLAAGRIREAQQHLELAGQEAASSGIKDLKDRISELKEQMASTDEN